MRLWFVNLLIPGGGVVLSGELLLGTLVALLFAVAANFAIWGFWIIPDDVAAWMCGLALALAAGTFVAAQLQLAQSLRRRRAAETTERRRRALEAACGHIASGEYHAALALLKPLERAARDDLLVAYRLAQVLTLARHAREARTAWRRLRAIDLHHIYRAEADAHERQLDALGEELPPPP